MKIAISMRVVENTTYPERRDALSVDWHKKIHELLPGATLIPLLNSPHVLSQLIHEGLIEGAILSNGNSWGEAPERDQTEKLLVEYCLKKNLPIVGVCRGFQALNTIFGGRVEKNIKEHAGHNHAGEAHAIQLLADTPFSDMSPERSFTVNSFHNQGVLRDGLAAEFKPFAAAENDVIEGFYHPHKPIIAIQWHPERPGSNTLFDAALFKRLFV